MSVKTYSIASGSRGNCLLISSDAGAILIDAGISARRLNSALEQCGFEVEQLQAVVLTHEHSDHSKAVKILATKHRIPIYANELTRQALGEETVPGENWHCFETGKTFSVGGFEICSFQVPHDAYDPVGFVLTTESKRIGVVTDLGYATSLVKQKLKNCHGLVVEANYDEKLLREDLKRPWATKQRIAARHGHLSNKKTAELIAEVDWPGLEWICLSHLSEDCNRPELAIEEVQNALQTESKSQVSIQTGDQSDQPTVLSFRLKEGD
ncbi:MAG: MBL fold metallo-hydrolase [Verrucomicrobiota bacterium]